MGQWVKLLIKSYASRKKKAERGKKQKFSYAEIENQFTGPEFCWGREEGNEFFYKKEKRKKGRETKVQFCFQQEKRKRKKTQVSSEFC